MNILSTGLFAWVLSVSMLFAIQCSMAQTDQQNAQPEALPPTISSIQSSIAQGDAQTALAALDQRIKADNNDIQSRFLKGIVLMKEGDNMAAQKAFTEITRLFPKLPEAFNNLAVLYVREGNYEKARSALMSAKANTPNYPVAHANLGDLYLKMAADAYRQALELDPDDQLSAAKLDALQSMFAAPAN